MKSIVMLILLALSSTALANGTCPNLNGVYKASDITAVRFTQNDCKSLSIAWGDIQEYGKIEWTNPSEKAVLNGSTTCNVLGCVTAKTTPEQIEMSRSIPWTLESTDHGVCDFYQVIYSLDAQGNLVSKHNIFNCKDDFMGWIEIVKPRLN